MPVKCYTRKNNKGKSYVNCSDTKEPVKLKVRVKAQAPVKPKAPVKAQAPVKPKAPVKSSIIQTAKLRSQVKATVTRTALSKFSTDAIRAIKTPKEWERVKLEFHKIEQRAIDLNENGTELERRVEDDLDARLEKGRNSKLRIQWENAMGRANEKAFRF